MGNNSEETEPIQERTTSERLLLIFLESQPIILNHETRKTGCFKKKKQTLKIKSVLGISKEMEGLKNKAEAISKK